MKRFFDDMRLSLRDLGVRGTLQRLPDYFDMLAEMRKPRSKLSLEVEAERFDERYGTDTEQLLTFSEHGILANSSSSYVHPYQCATESSIAESIRALSIDYEKFSFLDLGCGKGKPILVASRFPFRRLIGVDISERCLDIARENVRRCSSFCEPSRVTLLQEDAEKLVFPAEPLVIYLFNPFPENVMQVVVKNLEASVRESPREVAIIYLFPFFEKSLEESEIFGRLPTSQYFTSVFATKPVGWAWPRNPDSKK